MPRPKILSLVVVVVVAEEEEEEDEEKLLKNTRNGPYRPATFN